MNIIVCALVVQRSYLHTKLRPHRCKA